MMHSFEVSDVETRTSAISKQRADKHAARAEGRIYTADRSSQVKNYSPVYMSRVQRKIMGPAHGVGGVCWCVR